MRLLLDTHAIVWWATGDERLSRRARAAISDPDAQVFISMVSAWEIQIKATLQKLELRESVDALYRSLVFTASACSASSSPTSTSSRNCPHITTTHSTECSSRRRCEVTSRH
jgi:PIN domain nuclease of toxin-antitoxin system